MFFSRNRVYSFRICFDCSSFFSFLYRISSVERQSFSLPKQTKDLDVSFKMDLNLWDCFGWKETHSKAKFCRTDLVICSHSREGKPPSYSRINMVELTPFRREAK